MAWPSWMPTLNRPATWLDWSAIFRDVIPREWPGGMFWLESQGHKDRVAFGESLAIARDLLELMLRNIWPQNDSRDLLFLERWESVYNVRPDGSTDDRTNRLISLFRQRGTMTYALVMAIIVKAWDSDDPSIITAVVPSVANVVATETLGQDTYSRALSSMHIYLVAQTSDPDLSLKNDILRRIKPTWQRWTAGRYKYGVMGTSAVPTIRSRYNGCVYNTRP